MVSSRDLRWQVKFGMALLASSIFIYAIHFIIFHDFHHIALYGVGDVAFLPVEVLLVSLIIHRMLSERERRERMEKLNMVIGAFFSELGRDLLAYFSDFDPKLDEISSRLVVKTDWSSREFDRVNDVLKDYEYSVDMDKLDLRTLKKILVGKRNFLLRLIENPNLLEHESFTDLLMAVFHLTEELDGREGFSRMPQTDVEHVQGDVKRVYVLLVHEWLSYMHHLKDNYPYLFSLAMRTNPFDEQAKVVVE